METTITVKATKRTGSGKGPARRLRAAGKLPAIVYGPGEKGQPISIDPKDIRAVLTQPLGRNTVFTLEIDGVNQLALVKSFDHHPLTRDLEHADFYSVVLDRPIVVEVPLTVVGKIKGVAAGGVLRQVFRKLSVKCTPDKIPAKLEIDATAVGLNETLAVKDLSLPEGVKIMLDPGQTIISVVAPEKEKAGDAAATPAAAAAAPAAAAKGAAPAKDAKAAAPAAAKKK